MARVKRFEDHRFIGLRDTMSVYDCDDPAQLQVLEERMEGDDLVGRTMVQTFAPDTLAEAANRGFRPVAGARI
jgi:hypothetical protein